MTLREPTSFSVTTHERAAVVEARGELDVVSGPPFRRAVQEAVDTGRPLVVIDLAHVSFLDSAGLAVVFGAKRLLPASQSMMLANVPDWMGRIFRLASVQSVVDVHTPDQPQPWLDEA